MIFTERLLPIRDPECFRDAANRPSPVETYPTLERRNMRKALLYGALAATAVGLAEYFGADTKLMRYIVENVGIAPAIASFPVAFGIVRR